MEGWSEKLLLQSHFRVVDVLESLDRLYLMRILVFLDII